MTRTTVPAECVCGKVHIEIDFPARWAWHDHSAASRRAHGAAYATYVASWRSRFRVTEGVTKVRRFKDPSAGTVRSFCARCGTLAPLKGFPGVVWERSRKKQQSLFAGVFCRLAVLAALIAPLTATAQPLPDLSKADIKVTKVAGAVYMLQGSDAGNIAALVGEDGIVLVDDEYAPLATKIAAALKGIGVTDKPVRFIINTHYHYDHTGGNAAFAKQGYTIIAHDNARVRLATGASAGNGGTVHFEMPPAERAALPVITFDHDVSVHLNGEDVRALHYPAGHTDGDAIIFFPKANVVHMGDDYVRYGFPFIDVQAGGSVEGMIKACEGAIEKLPADVKIIPGHGEVSNVAEVREYIKMLKGTSAVIEQAIKAGKTLDQMKNEKLLAAWSAVYSNDFVDTDAFIDTLYNSLTHQQYTKYIKHN